MSPLGNAMISAADRTRGESSNEKRIKKPCLVISSSILAPAPIRSRLLKTRRTHLRRGRPLPALAEKGARGAHLGCFQHPPVTHTEAAGGLAHQHRKRTME